MTRPTGKNARPSRLRFRRLFGLFAVLVAAGGVLAAQQFWFSPEARERRAERMSLAELERQAPGSRDPLIPYYLSRRRAEVGDLEGALAALQAALRLDPAFPRARAALGTVLMSLDRDEEAVLELRQAIQDDRTNVEAFLALALFYQRYEAWQREAQAAEVATQLQPGNAAAWVLLGEAAQAQRDVARAAGCFERAVAAAPRDPRPLALVARARLALGDLGRADQFARAAIRAGPREPLGYVALGETLLRRDERRRREAEQAFEQAIAMGAPGSDGYFGLATALHLQGREVEAEQQYRFALRADPTQNEARYGLARSLRAQGREAEAAAVERQFRSWVRFEEERAALNDRIALRPEEAKGWFALARLYAGRGLWEQARRLARSGLRRAPADLEGQKLLAQIEEGAARVP
jgi:tetratricopeptide (TPR) repeat protein